MRPSLAVLALFVVPALAQLRLVSPQDPSLCDGLCGGGRCDDTHRAPVEQECRNLMAGGSVSAVTQALMQPRDGSAWERSVGGAWLLRNVSLSRVGGDRCASLLADGLGESARLNRACSACGSTPEAAAVPGSAAIVGLHHCAIHEKALHLREYGAVLAIARRQVRVLGLYSQQAKVYYQPEAAEASRVKREAAPTVMIDKYAGLTLLALLSFNVTAELRLEVLLQPNEWDEQMFAREDERWTVHSVSAWVVWSCLLLLALHNVFAHIGRHGVRIKTDKVLQILLVVLATTLVHFIRQCYLWRRTALGDVVSSWADQFFVSLYLPLAFLLPMLTGSRLDASALQLRHIANRASQSGEVSREETQRLPLRPPRNAKLKRARHAAQAFFSVLLLGACGARMVAHAANLTATSFFVFFLASFAAASLVLLAIAVDYLLTLVRVCGTIHRLRAAAEACVVITTGAAAARSTEARSTSGRQSGDSVGHDTLEEVERLLRHVRHHTLSTLLCFIAALAHLVVAAADVDVGPEWPYARGGPGYAYTLELVLQIVDVAVLGQLTAMSAYVHQGKAIRHQLNIIRESVVRGRRVKWEPVGVGHRGVPPGSACWAVDVLKGRRWKSARLLLMLPPEPSSDAEAQAAAGADGGLSLRVQCGQQEALYDLPRARIYRPLADRRAASRPTLLRVTGRRPRARREPPTPTAQAVPAQAVPAQTAPRPAASLADEGSQKQMAMTKISEGSHESCGRRTSQLSSNPSSDTVQAEAAGLAAGRASTVAVRLPAAVPPPPLPGRPPEISVSSAELQEPSKLRDTSVRWTVGTDSMRSPQTPAPRHRPAALVSTLNTPLMEHQELTLRFDNPDELAHCYACLVRAARGLYAGIPRALASPPKVASHRWARVRSTKSSGKKHSLYGTVVAATKSFGRGGSIGRSVVTPPAAPPHSSDTPLTLLPAEPAAVAATAAASLGPPAAPPPVHVEDSAVDLRVMVGTWNMGNARPTSWRDVLNEWLPLRTPPPDCRPVDVFVLGVQEAEFNSPVGFTSCESEWRTMVRAHLGDRYTEVAVVSLWEIRTFVAVRSREASFVSNVNVCRANTGRIAGRGVLGNKGAITVSFDYMSTRMVFTTAHFAAHQKRVKPRNDTFQEICAETVLPSVRAPELGDFTVGHDVCFFCGDLNYRLELPRRLVIKHVEASHAAEAARSSTPDCEPLRLSSRLSSDASMCSARDEASACRRTKLSNMLGGCLEIDPDRPFQRLWGHDQLLQEIGAMRVFNGWTEVAPPNFPPTYKYTKHSPKDDGPPATFRVYSDESRRVPSYTDRILVRVNRADVTANTLEYTDVTSHNVLTSDHAPVRSHVLLTVPLPALDVCMGLGTPKPGASPPSGFSFGNSIRKKTPFAAALSLGRKRNSQSPSPPGSRASLAAAFGPPLGLHVQQLQVHLSPGAIASRRLGKEQKHVKEQRKRLRERNNSLDSIQDAEAVNSPASMMRFRGCRPSVVQASGAFGRRSWTRTPSSRRRNETPASNRSAGSTRDAEVAADDAGAMESGTQGQVTPSERRISFGAATPATDPATTPTVSRTVTPEVVRENSLGLSNSLKALRSGLHQAVSLRRFISDDKTKPAEDDSSSSSSREGEEEEDEEEGDEEEEGEEESRWPAEESSSKRLSAAAPAPVSEKGVSAGTLRICGAAAPASAPRGAEGDGPDAGDAAKAAASDQAAQGAASSSLAAVAVKPSRQTKRSEMKSRVGGDEKHHWWAPKAGDRVTAGISGSSFPQDSFNTPEHANNASSIVGVAMGRASIAFGRASIWGAQPAASPGHLGASVLEKAAARPSDPTADESGRELSPVAAATPRGKGRSRKSTSGSSLQERLKVMEDAWGSQLLEASFDAPIAISTQLRSLPVLRQQPVSLVVQTKSTIASCRLDLGGLVPMPRSSSDALRCEMHFELPLVRHGLVIGVATGVLEVSAMPERASSRSENSFQERSCSWASNPEGSARSGRI